MAKRPYNPREQDIDLAIRRVLNTSDGQHLQQFLIDEYPVDLINTPGDSSQTHFKLGQHEVAMRLLRIANEELPNE